MHLKSSSKTKLVLTTFLGCTALAGTAYAASTVPAKTSWAISRVASVSQGSYCTMAQQYADETVMTFARNARGEYSLALDFQEPHFKAGEKQTITLRPQGGAAQTYSINPQSDKTAVVGIGKDTAMIKQIGSTENLDIEVAGTSLSFALSQFASGQKELGSCIEALQSSKDKTADLAQSTKTGMASPDAIVNRQVAVVKATAMEEPAAGSEPSVEGLLAAKPTPSVGVSALSSEDIPVPVPVAPKNAPKIEPKIEMKAPAPAPVPVIQAAVKDTGAEKEIAALREENARLTRAMSEQRQAFENQQATANGAALDELRQKLDAAKAENDKLRLQQMDGAEQKGQLARLSADLEAANKSTKSLQDENQSLKSQLATQSAAFAKVGTTAPAPVNAASNQELEALKAENTTLRNQIQVYASQKSDVSSVAAQLAQLQTENAQLKADLAKKSVVKAADAKPMDDKLASMASELDRQKQTNQALQSENNTLKNQIQVYAKTPVKAEPVVASADTEKLQKEVRDLRTQMETTQSEKMALMAQLDKLQKSVDNNQIKMAGGSWDLEQATRRYQESQREIQRLGAQLQSQQAKCTAEKKEIEYMLFDPKIANSSQIAMLNSLEEQVAEKDKQLKAAEAKLASATGAGQASPEKDQKIAELQKQLSAAQSDMAAKIQEATAAQNTVIASLKDELAKKDKTVFDTQAKLADAQNSVRVAGDTNANVAKQAAAIDALKMQLADTQKQLNEARVNAQQVDAKTSATQAATLATLQMQVQQGNQKIAELQNQVAGMKVAATQPAAAASIPVQPAPVQNIAFAAPKAAPAQFLSMDEFSGILKTAGVPVRGSLQQVKGGDPASYRAYSWKTDSLYGSVEMRAAPTSSAFDTVVGQYLARAKARCSGEFAAVPSAVKASNVEQSKSFEIACVNSNASSSASVLFTYGNGIAMTVAHEGRAEAMDVAMDARDRVAGQIR